MSPLAEWLRTHRVLRVLIVVASFMLPFTNLISSAIVVITARFEGWRSATLDCAAALAGVLLAATALALPWPSAAFGAGSLWGGSILAGHLLGRFGSVDLVAQLLVVAAASGVGIAALVLPDPREHWLPILEELLKTAGMPQLGGLPETWLSTLAGLMHGVFAASILFSVFMGVLLAHWALARSGGPGLRAALLELRLGRVLSLATVAGLLAAAAGSTSFGGALLLVLGTGFVVQGLSVIHWLAEHRRWPAAWPIALYGPLLFGAPVAGLILLILTLAGFLDNWVGLRRPRVDVV